MPSHHHEEHESSSNKLVGCDSEIYHNCDNHSLHDPFWYNHDTPPPETASSIQSLLLNGNSTGETHCKEHACCTGWEVEDDREHEGHDGCQEHRGPLSPSIMIPGVLICIVRVPLFTSLNELVPWSHKQIFCLEAFHIKCPFSHF